MSFARSLIAVPLLALLLTGCVPQDDGAVRPPETDPTGPAVTATPIPTATVTAAPDAIPLSIACDDLISAQDFYDYNPNFSLLSNYSPGEGTLAAAALNAQGVACRWINQTSGATIDISAAHLTDTALASATAEAASSGSATTDFGADGYFTPGTAQAFSGPIWVAAVSSVFGETADASKLMRAAVANAG